MVIIKEPLDVDFVVDSRPLTVEEEKVISDFILADREMWKLKNLRVEKVEKRKGQATVTVKKTLNY